MNLIVEITSEAVDFTLHAQEKFIDNVQQHAPFGRRGLRQRSPRSASRR
jgi:hypothetical protein